MKVSEAIKALKAQTDGDIISRQDAIDAILAVTGNSSVRELYEHVQEHGLSEMWSGGVSAAIDVIIAVPSAQPELPDWVQKVEKYRKSAPSYVQKPLAWALYQTWKEFDR